jgi:hypothetical protein
MFVSKIIKAENSLSMMSNDGGLKITKKCKIPGYKYLVWYSKKAITNIICLKNLIKCYGVMNDSELNTIFVVHHSAFGLPDLLFEVHPCDVHICYPKKMDEFGFVQTVEDNLKLFSKQQIAGVVQARDMYNKLMYPSTSDFSRLQSNCKCRGGPGVGCNHRGPQGRMCNLGPICSQDEREHCEEEQQLGSTEYCQGSQGAHQAPT